MYQLTMLAASISPHGNGFGPAKNRRRIAFASVVPSGYPLMKITMKTCRFLLAVVILSAHFALTDAAEPPPRLFPDIALRFPVGDPDADNPISDTEGPKTLAAGDLNGDGRADVVAGNLDGSISVLLGQTNFTLGPQILIPASGLLSNSSLRAVALGDFNGDGNLDAVVGDIAREGIVVLLGAGNGTLVPFARTPLGPVRAIAAADFDDDNKLDLLVACSPPDCEGCTWYQLTNRFLGVLHGYGDGTFGAPQFLISPGTDSCFYDVDAADLNGDGHVDAAALDSSRCYYPSNYVSHTRRLRLFANDGDGGFPRDLPTRVIESAGEGPRAFRTAYLDERSVGGTNPPGAKLDLVVVNRDSSSIDVFLNNGSWNFSAPISFYAAGGPRDVALADLDSDGYSDLLMVHRFDNELSVRRGIGGGRFDEPAFRLPTGVSPRNIVVADFNGDGILDAALNNRISEDIALFPGAYGLVGFLLSDNFYPAGITPVSVVAEDFNGDGFPDVATANLRSHDVRVRLNVGNGRLTNETVYPVNYQPAIIASGDVNRDGQRDLVVTCMGSLGGAAIANGGSLVTLLGRGDGTFAPPITSTFSNAWLRPFWLRLGYLDDDDVLDVVIGGINGHLVACRGLGNGNFAPETPIHIPRWGDGRPLGIALGDFDKDGWVDIATSRGVIAMNDGHIFDAVGWGGRSKLFNAGTQAWAVEADDLDRDGNLDLMVALTFVRPDPIGVYYGFGDGTLTEPTIYSGPDVGVVALAARDMDGDNIKDIVVGNRCAATVIIMKGRGDRTFEYREIVNAYSVEDVEVADMNQDGKPDIVGVGVGLWVAINGGTNHLARPSGFSLFALPDHLGVYINEFMALNTSYQVTNSSTPDWIELYNYNSFTQNLAGWSLAQYTADGETNRWFFPTTNAIAIPPFRHLVVYCKNKPGTNAGLYANFELSSDGENIALLRPDGTREDFVTFPAQLADVSYARLADGARFFGYNPSPTLGARNQTPGNLDPIAERKQPYVGPGASALGANARFFDDVAIAYAGLCYRIVGSSNDFSEVVMSDDGLHGDKLGGDAYYGALLPPLPPGTEIEYYVRVVDIEGESGAAPKNFTDPSKLYRLTVPAPLPALRLTELVAANSTGLRDERNQSEDWIEVWNSGATPIGLSDYALSLDYFERGAAWSFPSRTIQPNERLVVFCDNDLSQGPLHASFKLLKAGDRVFLIRTNTWTVVDSLSFGAMPTDTSFGVVGQGTNAAWLAWPTPGAENISIPPRKNPNGTAPEIFWRITDASGARLAALRWLGATNRTYRVETSADLETWETPALAPSHLGEGMYEWVNAVSAPTLFYRVASP